MCQKSAMMHNVITDLAFFEEEVQRSIVDLCYPPVTEVVAVHCRRLSSHALLARQAPYVHVDDLPTNRSDTKPA